MERYDYYENVMKDVFTVFEEEPTLLDYDFETILCILLGDDSVTGALSNSYFCDTWSAEEAICHNWDLIKQAKNEGGYKIEADPNDIDVVLRMFTLDCHLLEYIELFKEKSL